MPGYETYEWNAVFAPAGTPPEVVTQLSQALAKVLKDQAIAEQLAGIGAEPIGSTPAELTPSAAPRSRNGSAWSRKPI